MAALVIIVYTLRVLASFDVVNNFIYIIFYIIMGYACIYVGLMAIAFFFDLSWIDDVLNLNNKAALFAFTGGFLGLTLIYAGANVGDGPGWWCVILAGGLGLIAWILLGLIVNLITKIFERVTVERDIGCGVRTGAYLLASGIILARASAGDWTSFYSTIVEFMGGWPVLLLAVLAMVIELYYILRSKLEHDENRTYPWGSVFWGILYVAGAIVAIRLLPELNENPLYTRMFKIMIG